MPIPPRQTSATAVELRVLSKAFHGGRGTAASLYPAPLDVDETLELVGIGAVADRRSKKRPTKAGSDQPTTTR
jgi:hypothetical protein